MALITQSDLEARLGRSLTSAEQSSFAIINQANRAYVEDVVLGSSVEDDSASSRYYNGAVQHLTIDPCTNVTELALVDDDQENATAIDTTDYVVEPINKTLKQMIIYRNGKLPTGIKNIKVTAKFTIYNDSNTLAVVKDALLEALESEINNTDNIKRKAIEGYSVEYADTQTKDALNKLKGLFPRII